MTKYFIIFLLITYSITAQAEDFYNVKYISNYDGDTINFDLGENLQNIFRYIPLRLYGIDTPEIKTKNIEEKIKAQCAKDFVKNELINSQEINLINCKKDKYFRINCSVIYDGKNLTEILLKNNLGYQYYGGHKSLNK